MMNNYQELGLGGFFDSLFGGVKTAALTPIREGTKIWYSRIMKGAAARLWPGFYSLRQAQALGIDLSYYASARDAAEKALKIWSKVKGKKDSLMKAIEAGARKKIGNQPWFLPFGDVKNDIVRSGPVTQTVVSASGKAYNIGVANESTAAIAQKLVNQGESLAQQYGAEFVTNPLVDGQTYYVPSAADQSKEKYGKTAETLVYNPSTSTVMLVSNTTKGGIPQMYGLGATGAEETVLGTILTISIPLMKAILNLISSIRGQPIGGAAGYMSELDPNNAAEKYRQAQQCLHLPEPQRTQCLVNVAGEMLPGGRELAYMLAEEQAQEASFGMWAVLGLGSLFLGTLLFSSGDGKKSKHADLGVDRPVKDFSKSPERTNSSLSEGMGTVTWRRKALPRTNVSHP